MFLCHWLAIALSLSTIFGLGRNPGVMAAYCRDILGKKNIVSIYLSCSPRLQALRFLKRELPPNVSSLLQALIGMSALPC